MRNVKFGMRNRGTTFARQFRIPHFAFRILFALVLSTPAAAQDPSGHWPTLHTQHFRVHFRPDYRARAVEAAREAERAYRLLSSELHVPRGIIDLTLSDDVDAANGFTTVFPSNRFTIFLTPPVTDPGLQNYDSWERLVIVHELTHVFHLDRSRGLWGTLQSIFGRLPGFFPNQYQPSWVIEGLATYYESRFTTGGRADGTFHREIVAADAATQRDGSRSQLIAGQLRYEPVPRIAPSGRSLAYVHDDWRGARRLRVIDPATGAVLRSHRVNGQVSYDWRGDTLIVAQLDYTSRWTVRSDLWRWTPDGAWTQLTAGARLMEPRAGGGVLAMLVLSGGDEGTSVGPLTRDATWGPAVPSPDGRWIVAPRNQNGRWALVRWRTGTPAPVDVLAQAAAG